MANKHIGKLVFWDSSGWNNRCNTELPTKPEWIPGVIYGFDARSGLWLVKWFFGPFEDSKWQRAQVERRFYSEMGFKLDVD